MFANIYLNEFDRFARQQLRPLAYMRYGDDFILVFNNYSQLVEARRWATLWLWRSLRLTLHPRNDVLVRMSSGLHYLGHVIYPGALPIVNTAMRAKITHTVTAQNSSSYQAAALRPRHKKLLPWLLLEGDQL